MQKRLDYNIQSTPKLHIPYSKGLYNKCNDEEQWIRISEGCPNHCEYCRESTECGINPIYFDIPKIVRNKVKIMDMNLIYKPKAKEIIKYLGSQKVNKKVVYYELICGIDFRYLDQEMADLLKKNRFVLPRIAWDHSLKDQIKIKNAINMLKKAGYTQIMIFIICNWKMSYKDCLFKLDLCKIWNVRVCACWFDNQSGRNIKPIYWSHKEIKDFNRKERKHNQMISFGIDPELI